MFIFRIALLLFIFDCNAMLMIEPLASKQLVYYNRAYTMFFNSTNNTEEILKNYNDAVSSCRLALTILNEGKTFVTGGSSASSGKIIRCTISKDDAKRVWQDQLKSLTDENDMRRMVDTGSLNIYIFDTVKREVFDRSRR